MADAMKFRTPDEVRAWLADQVKERATGSRNAKSTEAVRWRVAGNLDRWLGKAPRRYFINHLFPHSDGSTKYLSYEELAALDGWMGLRYDPLDGWIETDKSQVTKQEMLAMVEQIAMV